MVWDKRVWQQKDYDQRMRFSFPRAWRRTAGRALLSLACRLVVIVVVAVSCTVPGVLGAGIERFGAWSWPGLLLFEISGRFGRACMTYVTRQDTIRYHAVQGGFH